MSSWISLPNWMTHGLTRTCTIGVGGNFQVSTSQWSSVTDLTSCTSGDCLAVPQKRTLRTSTSCLDSSKSVYASATSSAERSCSGWPPGSIMHQGASVCENMWLLLQIRHVRSKWSKPRRSTDPNQMFCPKPVGQSSLRILQQYRFSIFKTFLEITILYVATLPWNHLEYLWMTWQRLYTNSHFHVGPIGTSIPSVLFSTLLHNWVGV